MHTHATASIDAVEVVSLVEMPITTTTGLRYMVRPGDRFFVPRARLAWHLEHRLVRLPDAEVCA